MSRKLKPMTFISKITDDWLKASYPNASNQDNWKHKSEMNRFLEYLAL